MDRDGILPHLFTLEEEMPPFFRGVIIYDLGIEYKYLPANASAGERRLVGLAAHSNNSRGKECRHPTQGFAYLGEDFASA